MPRRAAARRRGSRSGRMRPIVLPSSHHLQLILSVPAVPGRGECGRAQSVSQAILCGAWRNGKRYQLHQRQARLPGAREACCAMQVRPAMLTLPW